MEMFTGLILHNRSFVKIINEPTTVEMILKWFVSLLKRCLFFFFCFFFFLLEAD